MLEGLHIWEFDTRRVSSESYRFSLNYAWFDTLTTNLSDIFSYRLILLFISLYLCMSVFLAACHLGLLSVYLVICMSVCSSSASVCNYILSICLFDQLFSASLSVYHIICLSLYLPVTLSVYPFISVLYSACSFAFLSVSLLICHYICFVLLLFFSSSKCPLPFSDPAPRLISKLSKLFIHGLF